MKFLSVTDRSQYVKNEEAQSEDGGGSYDTGRSEEILFSVVLRFIKRDKEYKSRKTKDAIKKETQIFLVIAYLY